jgi:hypothetical protein
MGLAVVFLEAGCVDPACSSTCQYQTIVTVTDAATGLPICGATVTASTPVYGLPDASVPFSYDPAVDGGCSGRYAAAIVGSPAEMFSVQVDAAGYARASTSVHGLQTDGCPSPGMCASQAVSVALSPM